MIAIAFSALAGICGTGLGGLIAVFTGKGKPNMMGLTLSFAGGVMIGIACFGLLPEAVEASGMTIAIAGTFLGIAAIAALNGVINIIAPEGEGHSHSPDTAGSGGHFHSGKALLRSGMVMLAAVGLHNIPVGIAIGSGGSHDPQLGMLLAAMITLHNIPEGMAIAAPLLAGGMKRWKAAALTALSGAPTLIGGVAGVFIGGISDTAMALSLSVAGGAMLYVVFGEIIPHSAVSGKTRTAALITLLGIVVGLMTSHTHTHV